MLPFVSVVVPVHNGGRDLETLRRSLVALDYPADRFEVIVVDNNSSDGTAALLAGWPEIRTLQETARQSSYAARNRGVEASRGDIVAFTDADCRVDPNWLQALVAAFDAPDVGAVAGMVVALDPATPIERLSERHRVLDQQAFFSAHQLPAAATANLALRRETLDALRGFNANLTTSADFELCFRLQTELSQRLVLAPQAVVAHRHRRTWRGLFAQSRRNGQAAALLQQRFPRITRRRSLTSRVWDFLRSLVVALAYPLTRRIDDLYDPLFLLVRYCGMLMGYLEARTHQ